MAAPTLEPADPDRFWHAEGKMKVSVQDTYALDEVPDAFGRTEVARRSGPRVSTLPSTVSMLEGTTR